MMIRSQIAACLSLGLVTWLASIGSVDAMPQEARQNDPPVAHLSVSPDTAGTTQTVFTFNASGSTDDVTSSALLKARWDWDGDGEFDTDFNIGKIIPRRYTLAGTYTVTLVIQDGDGLTDTLSQAITVSFEPDSGTVPAPNTPYTFDFKIQDLAFDLNRPYVYLCSTDPQRLYVVNTQTGIIERFYSFDFWPQSLTLTPAGDKLYLTMLTEENDTDPSERLGVVAEFHLDTQTKTNQYVINEDPFDIVATDDGYLFITNKTGHNDAAMHSYRASDGEAIDVQEIDRSITRIKLHPDQNRIYGADIGNDSRIDRWSIEEGMVTQYWNVEFNHPDNTIEIGQDVYLSPTNEMLLTIAGELFSTSTMQAEDLLFVRRFSDDEPLFDVVFDQDNAAIFAQTDLGLEYFNLMNYEPVDLLSTFPYERVGASGDSIFALNIFGSSSTMDVFLNPMLGAGTNTAPVAAFSIDPTPGTTLSTYTFDASSSSDAESDRDQLLIRWDWDSDGIYDTPFDTTKVVKRVFYVAGEKQVTLQVKDHFGLRTTFMQQIDVAFETDEGIVSHIANIPYSMYTERTDHDRGPIETVAFDPVRPYAYISSKVTQHTDPAVKERIHFMNLHTGLIEKDFQFDLDFIPRRLFITLDNKFLFVAFAISEESPLYKDARQGLITVFDLTEQVKINQFYTRINPYDFAATTDGYLYVAREGFDVQGVESYRVEDGAFLETAYTELPNNRVKLYPDESRMFLIPGGFSPINLAQYSISAGTMGYFGQPPFRDEGRSSNDVAISPFGDILITNGGEIYDIPGDVSEFVQFNRVLLDVNDALGHVVFDTTHAIVFTVTDLSIHQGNEIRYFDMETYEQVAVMQVEDEIAGFGIYGDSIFVATSDNDSPDRLAPYPHIVGTYVSVEEGADIPHAFTFGQNFPNPFRGSTQIKIGLPEPSPVTLKVFNLLGQEVATMVDQHLPPGHHVFAWEPFNLSAGVYFARMVAGDQFSGTIKLMLLK